MRLRRSVLSKPGIARMRSGKGFSYHGPDGEVLADEVTLERIKDLVIPPAWKKVWISPHPNGHIQAVGTDVAGRRQYLYHQAWQDERAEEKFDRVLEMSDAAARVAGAASPRIWPAVACSATGCWRWRCTCWTAGTSAPDGEQYAEEQRVLRPGHPAVRARHAAPRGGVVRLPRQERRPTYTGRRGRRGGARRPCPAAPRPTALNDYWCAAPLPDGSDIRADDLNARFKELVGDDYSVKDLRTWHGTVLAAEAFVDADPPPESKRVIKRVEVCCHEGGLRRAG